MAGVPVSRIEIAPSILASDFLHLADAVDAAEVGGADRLHLDVMDGRFVPNISFGSPIVEFIRRHTRMYLEVHLMVVAPEDQVPTFAEVGADGIIVHAEVSPHLYRTLQHIHDHGKKAGVAINPATPWSAIEEVLDLADLVLVMTINPGFGGQEFIEQMLGKIEKVRSAIDRRGLSTELEVDGGINMETVERAVGAGARVLVAGTAVYGAQPGVGEAIRCLRDAGNAVLDS
jgi:ribulose-phosphate 3-epimerase